MKSENWKKILGISVLIVLLSFSASAQVSSSGPLELLNDVATSISDNEVLDWLEADTIEELLIFLGVPILSFYAITRLIVTKGIEYGEQNFRENSDTNWASSNEGLSDMADWTARMLSIGVSTVAVVQYGGLFYNIAFVFGLAIVAGIIWVFGTGARGVFDPNPFNWVSSLSGGNNGGGGTGFGGQVAGGDNDPAGDAEDDLNRADSAAAAAAGEENEASNENSEGGAENDLNDAEQDIERAVQALEKALKEENQGIKATSQEINDAVNTLEQIYERDSDEEAKLEHIENEFEGILSGLEEIKTNYEQAREKDFSSQKFLDSLTILRDEGPKIQNIYDLTGQMVEWSQIEEEELAKSISELNDAAKEAAELKKALTDSIQVLEEIEQDEGNLEDFLNRLENQSPQHRQVLTKLEERVSQEESQTEEESSQIKALRNELSELEKELERAKEVLEQVGKTEKEIAKISEKIEEIESQEINALKGIGGLLDGEKSKVIEDMYSDQKDIDVFLNTGGNGKNIGYYYADMLTEIEKRVDTLRQTESEDIEQVEKADQFITETLNKLEN